MIDFARRTLKDLEKPFLKSFKVCRANFYSLNAHCFWLGVIHYFFDNPESKVAWSHLGSNSGPSDSQPDDMTIYHGDPWNHVIIKLPFCCCYHLATVSYWEYKSPGVSKTITCNHQSWVAKNM